MGGDSDTGTRVRISVTELNISEKHSNDQINNQTNCCCLSPNQTEGGVVLIGLIANKINPFSFVYLLLLVTELIFHSD